ncbi:MAG: peptide ABC transporter substrate-binding protein [Deltaproteobacteria bacterium]|nr:peptide ABC transporter substrate-binding protein [Deltaproteobacteria bacterium]
MKKYSWTRVSWIAVILLMAGLIFYAKPWSKKSLPVNEFRFVIASEPPTLDWSLATDNVSADIIFNLMEGLVQYDADLNVQPALAEKWDISKDGLRYTFYLKKDVVWSDGNPLTAYDFVYGWQRLLDPKTASEYAYFLFDVKNAQDYNSKKLSDFNQVGVHAKDDHTLVVDLWHPASYFLTLHAFWATFPLRKDIVEKFGSPQWTEPATIVTCGPFKLKAWEHDYKVILEANPLYYGAKPKIQTATAYIINEDSTALSLYETGKVDLIRRIPPLLIARYKNHPDHRSGPFLRGYYYGMNVLKKPFSDVRVRKAFSMAIDRTQLTALLQGNQIPTTSWVPKGMLGYEPEVGLKFDLDKARLLLAQAGYPNARGFPQINMAYDTRDDNKVIAENLQQQWKQNLNIDLGIENQEWKVYIKQLQTDAPPLWRLGWGADFPDPDNFLNLFTSYSGNNLTRWKNKSYDAFIEAGAKEQEPSKRLAIYHKAQKILTEEEVPIIPLFIDAQNVLIKPYITGYSLNAMAINILKNVEIHK